MPAAPRKSTTEKRHERPFSVRAFAGSPTSVNSDTRSFDIVITTETPVRTWIPDPRVVDVETQDCSYIEVDEVLLTEGLDYSRTPRMPLLDSYDSYSSIDKIAGKIEQVRAEGQSVVGRAFLTSKRADILPDIADRFYGQCSAGYCVLEYPPPLARPCQVVGCRGHGSRDLLAHLRIRTVCGESRRSAARRRDRDEKEIDR
jgi:hypothetical protein